MTAKLSLGGQNKMKKFLFISDLGPSELFSGGLVMSSICQILDSASDIDFVIMNSNQDSYHFTHTAQSNVWIFDKPGEKFPKLPKHIRELFGRAFELIIAKRWIRVNAKNINQIIIKKDYDAIFLVIQGNWMPRLLENLERGAIQTIIQYWDPVEWHIDNYNLSRFSATKLIRSLIALESIPEVKIMVPSEGMAEAICERSSGELPQVFVLYPPGQRIDPRHSLDMVFENIRENTEILITFAGALYAKDAVLKFIEALEMIDYKIGERQVALALISSDVETITSKHKNLYLFPRTPPAQVSLLLKNSDMALLPYPFFNEKLTSQAFPSKFSTYALNCKNIFIISPEKSSLVKFARKSGIKAGIVTTLSAGFIVSELKYLFQEPQRIEQEKALLNISSKVFDEKLFTSKIKEIFRVESNLLRKASYLSYRVSQSRTSLTKWNTFFRRIAPFIQLFFKIFHLKSAPKAIFMRILKP